MTAEMLALTEDSRPSKVRFRFDVALEDESLRWIAWDNGSYKPFTPPAVGATARLCSQLTVSDFRRRARREWGN